MTDNIPVVLRDLPTHIRGFVCLGSDYSPCIIINSRLPFEQQQETFRHEMEHIEHGHMDDENYYEYGDPA